MTLAGNSAVCLFFFSFFSLDGMVMQRFKLEVGSWINAGLQKLERAGGRDCNKEIRIGSETGRTF